MTRPWQLSQQCRDFWLIPICLIKHFDCQPHNLNTLHAVNQSFGVRPYLEGAQEITIELPCLLEVGLIGHIHAAVKVAFASALNLGGFMRPGWSPKKSRGAGQGRYCWGIVMLRVKAMPMDEIRSEIDAEIARLQQVRTLLFGSDAVAVKRKLGRPVGSGAAPTAIPVTQLPSPAIAQPRRKMSAAGRARIAAAMKMRWAKVRRAAKKAAKPTKLTQAPVVAAALPKTPAKKVASKKSAPKKSATKKRAAKKASPSQTSVPSPSTA